MSKSQIKGPEIGYIDILDAQTLEYSRNNPFNKIPIRPSSAGKCTRELAYDLAVFRGDIDSKADDRPPSTSRLLDLGHYIESHIIKHFRRVEFFKVTYTQQRLSFGKIAEDEFLEGQNDLCFWSDEYKCVVDIKSKKDKFSAFYKTKWDEDTKKLKEMQTVVTIGDEESTSFWVEDLDAFIKELKDPFFEANFLQLNLYCLNEFFTEREVDHGCIIQYNKNDSRLREVRFKPSKKLYNKVMNKFKLAVKAVDTLKDPSRAPKDYTLGSIKCAFCDHQKHCWGEDSDALRAYFANFPKKNWPIDTSDLTDSDYSKLEEMYAKYKEASQVSTEVKPLTESIIKELERLEINKIRFDDGYIYDVVFRKTPKPHYTLKRSKL